MVSRVSRCPRQHRHPRLTRQRTRGEKAGLRTKSLANPNYKLISLVVSQKEYDAALEFARKVSLMDITWDEGAMWRSYCNPCVYQSLWFRPR